MLKNLEKMGGILQGRSKWLVLVVGILVAGTTTFLILFQKNRSTHLVSPRQGPLVESIYGLGTVIAPRTFQLKIAVPLMVQKIHVQEGDAVKQGTPLISFDDGPTRKAPFDGVVTHVPARQGEIVTPNAVLLAMSDLGFLQMEVSLEQQSAMRIRLGQQAVVTFESLRGQKFAGKVDSLFPREGQFVVRVAIVGGFPKGILPAMTADVAIETGRRERVLQIPAASFTNGRVIRVRNQKKEKISVHLGVSDGEWSEVIDGDIQMSDQLVVRAN